MLQTDPGAIASKDGGRKNSNTEPHHRVRVHIEEREESRRARI